MNKFESNPTGNTNPKKLEPLFARLASDAWMAALRLGLPQLLAGGPATAQAAAASLGCDPRAIQMLLDALVGTRHLERMDGKFTLAGQIKELLALPGVDAETLFADELEHMERLARDWGQLAEVVRSGQPVARYDDEEVEGESFVHLARHLFARNYLAGREVFQNLPASHRSVPLDVLDVGGGSAAWSLPFAEAQTETRVTVADFEPVLEVARHFAAVCGVAGQYGFKAGNIRDVEFEAGRYDAAILGHVCHSEGAMATRELFCRMHNCLRPGGLMLVVDFIPDDERRGSGRGAMPLLFALNMLVHTSEGGTFTFAEFRSWAVEAGFKSCRQIDLEGPATVLVFAKDS